MIPNTIETPDQVKARGAFYTPPTLTEFMVNWAVRAPSDRVLEPASGDGAFVGAVARRFAAVGTGAAGLIAVEREFSEAEKVRALVPDADVRAVDFFDLSPEDVPPVDSVVGNPPYIRYQGFVGQQRAKALARASAQDVTLTGLASSWAHFLVHSTGFLKDDGRLALVLPAELLHADYAKPVRDLLLRRFRSVTILAFDRMVFDDAQVDAVVLLASNDQDFGLRVIRLPDARALQSFTLAGDVAPVRSAARWSGALDAAANETYVQAVSNCPTAQLGDWAEVDIGFVSGANAYFMLTPEDASALGLGPEVLSRAVGRPRDVPGLEVREPEQLRLLNLVGVPDLDAATLRYLARGVELGIHERYKCRHRRPWYGVPLPRKEPDALIPYMAHRGPRLIVNQPGTRNSNLLHGVTLRASAPPVRALAVAMCGSITLLSAEIEGRAYGGGVLKLETKEAERLRIPAFDASTARSLALAFGEVDALVRAGEAAAAARIADYLLHVDHNEVWSAYVSFRARRLGRKRHPGSNVP